jgi:hypothetical protein
MTLTIKVQKKPIVNKIKNLKTNLKTFIGICNLNITHIKKETWMVQNKNEIIFH